nr:uncharacterized protein LOC127347801 [Lolium perenne]
MKLTVKTLMGIHFQIRVQHHDTIMAVKTKIEEIQGKDSYPRGQQMLIYKGKVLKDESTLDKNQVTEDKFLIVMLCKSKALASTGTSSAKPLSTPVSRQAPPIAQPQASQSMVSATTTAQPEIPSADWNQANPSRCFVASPVVQGVHQQAEGRPPKTLARAAGGVGRKDVRRSGRGHRGAAIKLMVKTLKGTLFEIRVQHHDTIMAVKKKIEEIQGKDIYPRGQQMLIYKDKVLKDESTLDENQVTDDEFLVVMLSKVGCLYAMYSKASAFSGTLSAKIMAVKNKIEEIQGKDSYPRGQQMLIYMGKVLKDESTLDENEVSENEFLVVMLRKFSA